MQNSKRAVALAQVVRRHLSQTASQPTETVTPKFSKLKEVQKKFGVDDGVPVHLKGGIFDKMLYQTTVAITMVGLGLSFQLFYQLANK